MSEFLAPFEAMLDALFAPARVRAFDAGADWAFERRAIEQSGFLDALLAEEGGGAGLAFAQAIPLWMALGSRAAPLEIGQAMIDRAAPAQAEAAHARAVLLAAAIAGAAGRVLAMSVEHANQRVQFGKPVGRQQAVQQQLAVMAEQAAAIRLAVELAASGPGWPTAERAATAKTVAALYAPLIANTAHAVHGAIGISAEHDLQLYTRRLHAWRLEEGGETLWAGRLGARVLAAEATALDWVRAELFG